MTEPPEPNTMWAVRRAVECTTSDDWECVWYEPYNHILMESAILYDNITVAPQYAVSRRVHSDTLEDGYRERTKVPDFVIFRYSEPVNARGQRIVRRQPIMVSEGKRVGAVTPSRLMEQCMLQVSHCFEMSGSGRNIYMLQWSGESWTLYKVAREHRRVLSNSSDATYVGEEVDDDRTPGSTLASSISHPPMVSSGCLTSDPRSVKQLINTLNTMINQF